VEANRIAESPKVLEEQQSKAVIGIADRPRHSRAVVHPHWDCHRGSSIIWETRRQQTSAESYSLTADRMPYSSTSTSTPLRLGHTSIAAYNAATSCSCLDRATRLLARQPSVSDAPGLGFLAVWLGISTRGNPGCQILIARLSTGHTLSADSRRMAAIRHMPSHQSPESWIPTSYMSA